MTTEASFEETQPRWVSFDAPSLSFTMNVLGIISPACLRIGFRFLEGAAPTVAADARAVARTMRNLIPTVRSS